MNLLRSVGLFSKHTDISFYPHETGWFYAYMRRFCSFSGSSFWSHDHNKAQQDMFRFILLLPLGWIWGMIWTSQKWMYTPWVVKHDNGRSPLYFDVFPIKTVIYLRDVSTTFEDTGRYPKNGGLPAMNRKIKEHDFTNYNMNIVEFVQTIRR